MTGAHALPKRPWLTGAQRLTIFATLLGGVAAVLWLLPLHSVPRQSSIAPIPWWAELVGCYAASLVYVQVRVSRFNATLSLTEIPVAMGLFLVDPHVLLGCYAAGVLAAHVTRRGPHPAKDYSNLLLDALCIAVTVLVFTAIGPDPNQPLAPRSLLALAAAMAAAGWVVTPVVLNAGISLFQGRLHLADYARSVVAQIVATTTNTCLGIMGLLFLLTQPLLLLVLIPPVLLVLFGQVAASENQRRADRMEFLFHTSEILHSTLRFDDRAGELLASMTSMFGVARAELVLVPEAREAAVRLVCNGDERVAVVTSSDLTYAEQEMLNTLRNERMIFGRQGAKADSALGLLLAERTASFGTAVSLRGRERPQGMLLLLDPLEGDTAPAGQEAELLLSVAQQISVALENGQLAGALRTMTKEREELTRRAFYDPLTQIANRSLFDETVTRALAKLGTSRKPLATLFIDLDGFKAVNDTYGHAAGDQVLSAVAARLRAQIRKFDMVARLGGDEFGILLDGMRRRDDVHIVAQRIVATLHTPIALGVGSVMLGGSVGVAVVDDPASAPPVEELLRRADMAMYLAKRQGKDRYVVFDTGARDTVIAAQPVMPQVQQAAV